MRFLIQFFISSAKRVWKSYYFPKFSWFLTNLFKNSLQPAFQTLFVVEHEINDYFKCQSNFRKIRFGEIVFDETNTTT